MNKDEKYEMKIIPVKFKIKRFLRKASFISGDIYINGINQESVDTFMIPDEEWILTDIYTTSVFKPDLQIQFVIDGNINSYTINANATDINLKNRIIFYPIHFRNNYLHVNAFTTDSRLSLFKKEFVLYLVFAKEI
jgi:hypothetical protein